MARPGTARHGQARPGKEQGLARPGVAGRGKARNKARPGKEQGLARPGMARPGKARNKARVGKGPNAMKKQRGISRKKGNEYEEIPNHNQRRNATAPTQR